MAILAVALPVRATKYCQNLAGTDLFLGEARYVVYPGDDEAYVNAYFDGGDELSTSRGSIAGGVADLATAHLAMGAYVYARDHDVGDWLNVTFALRVTGGNSLASNGCPTGSQSSYTATMVWDTTGHPLNELAWASTSLRISGVPAKRYWTNTIESTHGGSVSGCFTVADDCALREYF